MIEVRGLFIFGNIASDQKNILPYDSAVGFVQRDMAETQALDFTAFQNNAAFECVDNMILMPSLAILRNMTGFLFRLGVLLVLFFPIRVISIKEDTIGNLIRCVLLSIVGHWETIQRPNCL